MTMGARIFVLLACWSVPMELSGQKMTARDQVHVAMTISGGISQGSYGAGVNWAMLEVFKASQLEFFRNDHDLPQYIPVTMTGASAGNINAFLTSVEWCRTRQPVPPHRSLLWMTWVSTGIEQLSPASPSASRALLSRDFFDGPLKDSLRAATKNVDGSVVGRCRMPVGATVTRQTPEEVEIRDGLMVMNQRAVAIVDVERSGNAVGFFNRTAPIDDWNRHGTIGSVIYLPDQNGRIPLDVVFELVKASSAFPLAFAPVRLSYRDSADADVTSALFLDGGVFDNSPIDLAMALFSRADPALLPHRVGVPQELMVLIDPGKVRRFPDSSRWDRSFSTRRTANVDASSGIAALMNLVTGMIGPARQYELQSMGRWLARIAEYNDGPSKFAHWMDQDDIYMVDRLVPIVGEHLGAFAAFLGRPFRMYDFSVGVYDGLNFISRHVCATLPELDKGPVANPSRDCVRQRMRSFVRSGHLDFGQYGLIKDILVRLYNLEATDSLGVVIDALLPEPPQPTEPEGRALRRVMAALVDENVALVREPFDNAQCETGIDIGGLLCAGGLTRLLTLLRQPSLMADLEYLHQFSRMTLGLECGERHEVVSAACLVTEEFLALVRDPEEHFAHLLGAQLDQLRAVEHTRADQQAREYLRATSTAEMIYRSTVQRLYPGRWFDWGVNTLPPGTPVWQHILLRIVPDYISWFSTAPDLLTTDFEAGYQPAFRFGRGHSLIVNAVPYQRFVNSGNGRRRSMSLGVHWELSTRSTLLTSTEFGVDRSFGLDNARDVTTLSFTMNALARRVRIGLRWDPIPCRPDCPLGVLRFSLGASDLPGLLYRAFR